MAESITKGAISEGTPALADDVELVASVLKGDLSSFELLMRRYNERLYRTIWSVLGDRSETEDVLQEAYTNAFHKLRGFDGRGSFGGWLTKIALHQAYARHREKRKEVLSDDIESVLERRWQEKLEQEEKVSSRELRLLLEDAISSLPTNLRSVFVMREVEGLNTEETADNLGISTQNVKVRLHRAKEQLSRIIEIRVGEEARKLFTFGAERCEKLVLSVISRIRS